MNKTDEVAFLDNLYMLEVDEPSELWTKAAQSDLSPEVRDYIDDAVRSATMLSNAFWLSIGFGALIWGLWKVFHAH